MPTSSVAVESLAWVLPPHRATSAELEADLAPTYRRLGVPARCIEALTGIAARRFWDEGQGIAEAAAEAAKKCLEGAGRPVADVVARTGLCLSTSVSKDFVEPSVAALVAGELGLPATCRRFDVGNACLGFLDGMDLAASAIERGAVDYALVVAAESSRRVVEATIARLNAEARTMQDFKENLPTLTLGSGAVAMLLCRADLATTTHRVLGSVTLCDGENNRICVGVPDRMTTDATKLLSAGVALAEKTLAKAELDLSFARGEISRWICHQVGAAHMATLFSRLGLDLDRAQLTYPELGNIGPAAVPLTLGLAVEEGRVRPGDKLALFGIGSGLSCSLTTVLW